MKGSKMKTLNQIQEENRESIIGKPLTLDRVLIAFDEFVPIKRKGEYLFIRSEEFIKENGFTRHNLNGLNGT